MVEQETIDHLVKTFRLAVTNLRIYPPSSQIVTATIDTFFKIIQTITESKPSLTFSLIGEKLLINGIEPVSKETLSAASIIIKLFHQKKVQSITFKKSVPEEEVTLFLTSILTKKREEFPQFPNIALDQTVYVATVKGEDMVVKISDNIKSSGGEISGLLKSIRESYDLIDTAGDPEVKEQLQAHLAEELAKQDSSVLKDIFDRELPPKLEQSGIKKLLLGTLSKDKIQNIFGDIAGWFDEIRKKEGSEFDAVEQLEKLKGFIHTILQAPAAKEFPRQFFEDLVRKGLLTELPSWCSQEQSKPATIFEVERLIEKDPAELVEKSVKDRLPELTQKLCEIDYNELIIKLLEKLVLNLKNPSANIRLPSADALAKICGVLHSNNKESILKYLELPVIEAAKSETSADTYARLLDILSKRAVQNLVHEDFDMAIRIIELFHLQSLPDVTQEPNIRAFAKSALEKLLPETAEILIEDLRSGDEKKRTASMHIFAKFGEQAVDPLIYIIKQSEDIRARKSASQALKNLGETAKKRFAEELNLGLTAEEIRRVVEALGDIGDDEMVQHLNLLLRYPDPQVKKDILKFLAVINTTQSKALLIDRLKDEDLAVVSEAARLLSQIDCREAVPGMVNLLTAGRLPAALQEELCIFLGSMKDLRAVPALVAKLKKKPSFFSRNKTEIERIRLRAAWSLRKFTAPEAENALLQASKDKNISVAMTAKESLEAMKKGPQK